MASAFSHVIVATALGKMAQPKQVPWWYWALGAIVSVLPDLDVISDHFGIDCGYLWAHRCITHSLPFAIFLSLLVSSLFLRQNKISFFRLFLFLALSTASHGVLDAMTYGGNGVAFFSPFSNVRYYFPFHPIEASPIGISEFFSEDGWSVIQSEAVWLWIPLLVLFAGIPIVRRLRAGYSAVRPLSGIRGEHDTE